MKGKIILGENGKHLVRYMLLGFEDETDLYSNGGYRDYSNLDYLHELYRRIYQINNGVEVENFAIKRTLNKPEELPYTIIQFIERNTKKIEISLFLNGSKGKKDFKGSMNRLLEKHGFELELIV